VGLQRGGAEIWETTRSFTPGFISISELGFEPGGQCIQKPAGGLPGLFCLCSFGRIRRAGIAEAPGVLREPLDTGQVRACFSGEGQAHLFQFVQS